MTGPHLTPEREAEIRRCLCDADLSEEWLRLQLGRVLAALDAERVAHAQTRTALTDSTALLIRGMGLGHGLTLDILDAQVQENQRILGLAVAEADKP